MLRRNLLIVGYIVVLIGFFFYSFTQIDLSLALSRLPAVQKVVTGFQYIGYFNRPQSTTFYLILLTLQFLLYIGILLAIKKKIFSEKNIWFLIGSSTVLFLFAYNAFSYDLFNYIFDARIISHYHANPYFQKALDYPGDPMLSFMRWTHRTYPYGPVWLGITVPLSFLSLQYFIVAFVLFKSLMAASFVVCTFFIGKILQKIAPERKLLGIAFFALNPLVLIESVMSAHIDIVMMAFAMWALYLLIQKKNVLAYILLFLSIGIKFVTGLILPLFILFMIWRKQKTKINWDILFLLFTFFISVGVVLETLRGNFQPWYIIVSLAYVCFLVHKYYVTIPALIISFFAMLTYVPFLFTGNWDPPIPSMLRDLYFFSYSLSFVVVAGVFAYKQLLYAKKHKETIIRKK